MKSVKVVGGNLYWNDIAFSLYHERYFSYPKFSVLDSPLIDYKESILEILNCLVTLIESNGNTLIENHKEWIMASRISFSSDFTFKKVEQTEYEIPKEVIQAQINYNNFDIEQLKTQILFTSELINRNLLASNLTIDSIDRTLINCMEVFSIIETLDNIEFEKIEYQLIAK
jgi:hypothetical protein